MKKEKISNTIGWVSSITLGLVGGIFGGAMGGAFFGGIGWLFGKIGATIVLSFITDIQMAAKRNDLEKVKLLLSKGKSINETDDAGFTGLVYAAQLGHSELVRFLLENGAEPNIAGRNGLTALITAANNGRTEIVKMLIEHGADTNAQLASGSTAVMLAEKNNHTAVIDLLKGIGVVLAPPGQRGTQPTYAPTSKTNCDKCGRSYPSGRYLEKAAGDQYLCEQCRRTDSTPAST
jgi:hypothetical protein